MVMEIKKSELQEDIHLTIHYSLTTIHCITRSVDGSI